MSLLVEGVEVLVSPCGLRVESLLPVLDGLTSDLSSL